MEDPWKEKVEPPEFVGLKRAPFILNVTCESYLHRAFVFGATSVDEQTGVLL
jgi:hypothetical protein